MRSWLRNTDTKLTWPKRVMLTLPRRRDLVLREIVDGVGDKALRRSLLSGLSKLRSSCALLSLSSSTLWNICATRSTNTNGASWTIAHLFERLRRIHDGIDNEMEMTWRRKDGVVCKKRNSGCEEKRFLRMRVTGASFRPSFYAGTKGGNVHSSGRIM